MAARTIFTIGYEQSRPEAVLRTLKKAKVQILVDTRAVAASVSLESIAAHLTWLDAAIEALNAQIAASIASQRGRRIVDLHRPPSRRIKSIQKLFANVDSDKARLYDHGAYPCAARSVAAASINCSGLG